MDIIHRKLNTTKGYSIGITVGKQLETDPGQQRKWDCWINEKPAHGVLARQAAQLLSIITEGGITAFPPVDVRASFDRLMDKIIDLEINRPVRL